MARGSVLASDAFFLSLTSVKAAGRAGVTCHRAARRQRSDPDVIAAADGLGIAMVLTGVRHFRH